MATFSTTTQQISGPVRVNTNFGDEQEAGRPVIFADGTGVIVFGDDDDRLLARFVDAQGNPIGSQVTLSSTMDSNLTEAVLLANGNIAVAWLQNDNIVVQEFTPAMQPVRPPIPALDLTNPFRNVSLIARPDGGFVVAGTYEWGSNDTDIYVRSYTGAGAFAGEYFFRPGSTIDEFPQLVRLRDGNIGLTWRRNDSGNADSIWTAVLSPSLGEIKAPSAVFTGDNILNVDAAPLGDGSFLVSFSYTASGGAEIIGNLKVSSQGTLIWATSPFSSRLDPTLATSAGGSTILVVEYDNGTDTDLHYAMLRSDGSTFNSGTLLVGAEDQDQSFVTWINDYTFQLAFDAGEDGPAGDSDEDAVGTARFRVVTTWTGNTSPELIVGNAWIDVMNGSGGNDTMNGAGGPDTMRGGAGNDVYYVDSLDDMVDEIAVGSEGWDTVFSSISYFLPTNVEAGGLIGSGSGGLWGNATNNALSGNAADNILDGSFGADTMAGGAGNDVYYVDQKGDFVDEYSPGSSGFDTVYSSVNYVLGPGLEGLRLMGELKIDGTGNALANHIVGNVAANVLKGGGGADAVMGSRGKDTIDGGAGKDIADYSDKAKPISVNLDGSKSVTVKVGTKSEDKIKNVEGIIGSIKGDKITGDSKDNVLNGHLGKDQLKGEGGRDQFVFNALGPANTDKIADFKHNTDKIALEDWVFWSIGGKLDKAEFHAKAGATKAHDADDRIVYNKSNGNLYYDADGKGGAAAVLFATLSTKPSIDHGDFIIV